MTADAARMPSLAARLALLGTGGVLVLLLLLHRIKPELDPSWRFLSEYAIGRNGWIMALAFELWAASCAMLCLPLWRETPARIGRVGVCVLFISAVALAVAGMFPQDPVTARPDELTPQGNVHAIASMIGIPAIPIAALLIGIGLARSAPSRAPYRTLPLWLAHATWLSLLVMAAYLAWAVPKAGGFGAEVWAGWMNRLVVATYLLWQIVVAFRLLKTSVAAAARS